MLSRASVSQSYCNDDFVVNSIRCIYMYRAIHSSIYYVEQSGFQSFAIPSVLDF